MSPLSDQASTTCRTKASSRSAYQVARANRDDPLTQHRLQADIRARLNDITGPAPSTQERSLLARILTTFPAKTLIAIDQLAQALQTAQTETVQANAHALKGSATNLGITILADLFTDIENCARRGQLPDPTPILRALDDALELATIACSTIAAEITDPAITTSVRPAKGF